MRSLISSTSVEWPTAAWREQIQRARRHCYPPPRPEHMEVHGSTRARLGVFCRRLSLNIPNVDIMYVQRREGESSFGPTKEFSASNRGAFPRYFVSLHFEIGLQHYSWEIRRNVFLNAWKRGGAPLLSLSISRTIIANACLNSVWDGDLRGPAS